MSLISFLSAFDGHQDTPVEALHVVLLGVAKYLYRDMVAGLTPANPTASPSGSLAVTEH